MPSEEMESYMKQYKQGIDNQTVAKRSLTHLLPGGYQRPGSGAQRCSRQWFYTLTSGAGPACGKAVALP